MATRYALWLSPDGEAFERWQALIAELSARLGTPAFDPHVTLVGGLHGEFEALQQATRQLALEIEPMVLPLGASRYLDEYYRCLFVDVDACPALARAQAAAARRFGPGPSPYYPHLSLVYGELPAARKQQLIAEIGARFDEPLPIVQLTLIEVPDGPTSWRCRARVALGGDDCDI